MRICIPIEIEPQGGGFYFLQNFEAHLKRMSWIVTKDLADRYELLFTNHWMVERRNVLRAIRHNPNVRIVQRIDGVAQAYGRYDDADTRQGAVNALADLTIFQSAYCRRAARDEFGVISGDGPVIHNPVEVERFRPDGPRRDLSGGTRIACVTWSTNPMKGAASIYQVARASPKVSFVLCGRYPDAPDLPNVHSLGVLDRDALATTLRSCHALLTFSRNEACPNHVLEALASGLPVLYRDSGAMSEVVGDCGRAVTVEGFPELLNRIMADRERLSAAARKRALDMFDPNRVLPRYLQEIEQAMRRPLRIPAHRRTLLAWADVPRTPFRAASSIARRCIRRLV